jgi:hypothetical protein
MDKRTVDDLGEGDSFSLSATQQGQGESAGKSGLTPQRLRSIKKKMTAQQRAQRRRLEELGTNSEALSHQIDISINKY